MASRPVRIFQIAKELNISHTEILSFLKDQGVDIASHMSPVDELIRQKILMEFSKDRENVERYRKEQMRREILDSRVETQREGHKKLQLLSLEDQRSIEKKELEEKQKQEEEKTRLLEQKRIAQEKLDQEKLEKEKFLEEIRRKEAEEKKAAETKANKLAEESKKPIVKKEKTEPVTATPSHKRKLRKIALADIQGKVDQGTRRIKLKTTKKEEDAQQSAKDRVRQTLAKIETKVKKKSHKRDRDQDDETTENGGLRNIQIPEFASVVELANLFDVDTSDIIQQCFSLGTLATKNHRLEWDVIELLAEENSFIAVKQSAQEDELFNLEDSEEDIEKAIPRSPVVTVMGHVDHGKTSILDYIRKTNVVAGESGGITQHIGAYKVELPGQKSITFLDTPGHEAFTAMRARGAQVTDIVILVVAADDAVMPQTIEAIQHAKAAGVPIVVAINKIDKPGADIDKTRRSLSDNGILVEEWGGKIQSCPVSAKTGENMDSILSAIFLEAEMLELKANHESLAKGTVIDSRLDRGHGPMATILVKKGTLNVGDPFICDVFKGKVRAILNERGIRLKSALPGDAVQILGFEQVPQAADIFSVVENEKDLKRIANERQRRSREIAQKSISTYSLDKMSTMIAEGSIRQLPLLIKGDVDGSIDALADTLVKLNTDEVAVNVIRKGVGMITESDVILAEASKAVIIGFHVQVQSNAKLQARQRGVEIRTYSVIYSVVEEIKLALEGMLEPEKIENILGSASVQTQFKIPKIGFIAGAKVTNGTITRNALARLIRDGKTLAEGKISSLKRFKDDAKEVKDGLECGIGIDGIGKYQEGDIIEVFEIEEVKRKLEKN